MLIIKKDILIIGKSPAQGLEHTLPAEKMYSVNFTVITMEQIVTCLLMVLNFINLKQKILKLQQIHYA